MTYVLYVPIEETKYPKNEKKGIAQWIEFEKKNGRGDIKVVYYSPKGKDKGQGLKDLPPNSKIYIMMHGTPSTGNPLAQGVDPKLASQFKSMASKYLVSDKKNVITVSGVAERMIEDGLFAEQRDHLRIKLFFCDPVSKGQDLAQLFVDGLKNDTRFKEGSIRVDYYQGRFVIDPYLKKEEAKAHKYTAKTSTDRSLTERASEVRYSFYNKENLRPKLSKDKINQIIAQHDQYKSARWWGLSGRLGLNNWFTSTDSLNLIRVLQNDKGDEAHYNYARFYLSLHAAHKLKLVDYLKPAVDQATQESNNEWKAPKVS